MIKVIGVRSSEILSLGPDYRSLVAELRSELDWIDSWNEHYHEAKDFEILRETNSEYSAAIMDYQESDLTKLREIRNSMVIAWHANQAVEPEIDHRSYDAEFKKLWNDSTQRLEGPRIFLGTNHTLGLAPPTAMVGDIIVQFWHCDAAIVMREVTQPASPKDNKGDPAPIFMLVGRVDVVQGAQVKKDPRIDQAGSMREFESRGLQAVCVKLDMPTLQTITANATAYK